MTKTDRFKKLLHKITVFAERRRWTPFHTPKNLSMALSVECAELVEIFQWMSPEESTQPDKETLQHIEEEIGDIMIYLGMIGASFNIDPIEAATNKLALNETKYPCPD